jgi:threonine dehydratase
MIDGLRRDDIARVHKVIASYVRRTPVLHTNGADVGLSSFPLTFKLEFTQHAGSFKARGAFNNLLSRPITELVAS